MRGNIWSDTETCIGRKYTAGKLGRVWELEDETKLNLAMKFSKLWS